MAWPMSAITGTGTSCVPDQSLTPLASVWSPSLMIAAGAPAWLKMAAKSSAMLSPLTCSHTFRPMHSQSCNWIAAPLLARTSTGTLSTTKTFLVPMSMEWSMIANHRGLIALTWLSNPNSSRNVQLITEVKCGIHACLGIVSALNKPRIRGTLRYAGRCDTTRRPV